MNLFEALCKHCRLRYKFHQFVVYHIPCLKLVEEAEIYFSRLGQGYSRNGGGLSHTGAGMSSKSRKSYDEEDYADFMSHVEELLKQNIERWKSRMDAKVERLRTDKENVRDEAARKNAQLESYRTAKREHEVLVENLPNEEQAMSDLSYLTNFVHGLRRDFEARTGSMGYKTE